MFCLAWKSICLVTIMIALWLTVAKGQPTIPESEPRWSDTCGTKEITSALELLTQEIEDQGINARILKVEMGTLREENKQFRGVLMQIVAALHQLVSKMADRHPCHCDKMTFVYLQILPGYRPDILQLVCRLQVNT